MRSDAPLCCSQNMNGFEQQWNEYRKRRNLVLFAFLGFMPFVGAVGSLSGKMFHTDAIFTVFALSWLGFIAVSSVRLNCWPCPRCSKWFAGTWLYRIPFARRCVHCGLPKYSNCC